MAESATNRPWHHFFTKIFKIFWKKYFQISKLILEILVKKWCHGTIFSSKSQICLQIIFIV